MRELIINHKEIKVIETTNYDLQKYDTIRVNSYGEIVIEYTCYSRWSNPEPFIKKNIPFIQKQLDTLKKTILPTFKNESVVYLLGRKYTVYRSKRIQTVRKTKNGIAFPRSYTISNIRQYLKDWLEDVLDIIYYHYIKKYNLETVSFHIIEAHSYWGICHRSRKSHFKDYIKFNTALIFVPIRLVEYVVVHELCHLKHMNHGQSFWDEVEGILPDAKKKRKLLHSYHLEWLLERLGVKRR